MKFCALIIVLISSFAHAQEVEYIQHVLEIQTMGHDSTYARIVLPGQSLQAGDKVSKVQSVNRQVVAEVSLLLQAFTSTESKDVVGVVRAAARTIDADLATKTGHIVFEGSAPMAMQARTLLFVPKGKVKVADPATVMSNSMSSYRRSAKKDDFVFEYENALNLQHGKITERRGSDTSWLKPEAAPAFIVGQDYALKKCRRILGWRCTTSIYHAEELQLTSEANKAHFLFSFTYDLENNPDHSKFSGSQSKNQLNGTTGVTIIKESADWIMMFVTDHRYKEDKQSFSNIVQSEFQEDMERIKQRLATDLQIAVSEIK